MELEIFDICRHGTRVLGPGNRYSIWVQGCLHTCPGCITPESRDIGFGTKIKAKDIAADIILSDKIDGITISGGEPFLQAKALISLLEDVRDARPELTVIIYTGYQISELETISDARRLMEYVDVIIDGRYIEDLNDNRGIRGSSNQRIIHLTTRLKEYADIMESGDRRLMHIAETNGMITSIGVPNSITLLKDQRK